LGGFGDFYVEYAENSPSPSLNARRAPKSAEAPADRKASAQGTAESGRSSGARSMLRRWKKAPNEPASTATTEIA
jgi:hypothetical protein